MQGSSAINKSSKCIQEFRVPNLEFCKTKGAWRSFYAPIDVVFDDDEVFQPDIVFIKSENLNIIRKDAIQGIPDLIVEIVSPLSTFYDTIEKKDIYRKYGVKEYWIIFTDEKNIEVLSLEKGEYLEFCKSKILEGLEIDSKDVFE